jgi:hypothetical protein
MLSTSSHEDARAEQGMDIKTTTALRSKFELCSSKIEKDQRPFYFIKMTLDITMTAAMLRHAVSCRHTAMHSSKQQKQQAASCKRAVRPAHDTKTLKDPII